MAENQLNKVKTKTNLPVELKQTIKFTCGYLHVVHTTSNWRNFKKIYTGCHRRKGPNFGRVFLMLNYTDITQNTYIQS